MKPIFFQIGEKAILLQKIQGPLDSLHVALAFILHTNQDVIQVDNDETIEFFGQNPIYVSLEAGRSIE